MSLFGSWAGREHRERGFDGPISSTGEAWMGRTTRDGKSARNFGWTGHGSPDDKRSPRAGKAARASRSSGRRSWL